MNDKNSDNQNTPDSSSRLESSTFEESVFGDATPLSLDDFDAETSAPAAPILTPAASVEPPVLPPIPEPPAASVEPPILPPIPETPAASVEPPILPPIPETPAASVEPPVLPPIPEPPAASVEPPILPPIPETPAAVGESPVLPPTPEPPAASDESPAPVERAFDAISGKPIMTADVNGETPSGSAESKIPTLFDPVTGKPLYRDSQDRALELYGSTTIFDDGYVLTEETEYSDGRVREKRTNLQTGATMVTTKDPNTSMETISFSDPDVEIEQTKSADGLVRQEKKDLKTGRITVSEYREHSPFVKSALSLLALVLFVFLEFIVLGLFGWKGVFVGAVLAIFSARVIISFLHYPYAEEVVRSGSKSTDGNSGSGGSLLADILLSGDGDSDDGGDCGDGD